MVKGQRNVVFKSYESSLRLSKIVPTKRNKEAIEKRVNPENQKKKSVRKKIKIRISNTIFTYKFF